MAYHSHLARFARISLLVALVVSCWGSQNQVQAQSVVTQQVGGIAIDAQGVLRNVRIDEHNALLQMRQQALQPVPAGMQGMGLRKVSLRRLEEAIAENQKLGTPLPDEMRYLAGLQRIQYVFVYPEDHDIVLAGPGEGWKISPSGEMVGITTGKPVMLLDDLLVSLRSIEAAKRTGFTCSIEPTADGLSRLNALYKNVGDVGYDPRPLMAAVEQQLGPQSILVKGVPQSSHFARVMVAADYRMKRIAMAFEESPVAALPSFMGMLQESNRVKGSMLPRWWLEPKYESLVRDADGLSWELPKGSVQAFTEEEVANAAGQKQKAQNQNPLAKKWADTMTARYEELSVKDPIFGQLRNCMDLAVVAALITSQNMAEKTHWEMAVLLGPQLPVEAYHAPKQVDSQASVVQRGSDWIISASGGVQIDPWNPMRKPTTDAKLSVNRTKAAAPGKNWWWD